jgi:hypothetical protein
LGRAEKKAKQRIRREAIKAFELGEVRTEKFTIGGGYF